MTPCQKCKADLERARQHLVDADRTWYGKLEAADARVEELERALGTAIERLGEFLQAFEGAPDPSENDTKRLVARLEDVLHNTGTDGQRETPPHPDHGR